MSAGTFNHDLRVQHRRRPAAPRVDEHQSDSEVDIAAGSGDLVTAIQELLSRMPNDLYQAFRVAITGEER